MYIFGGNTAGGLLNDLWEYTLDTRAWTQVISARGSAPSPHWRHSLIALGDRLVLFGGRGRSALHCFDLQRRRWSNLTTGGVRANNPCARSGHTLIPCGGGVLIFGGRGLDDEYLNDTVLLRVWP